IRNAFDKPAWRTYPWRGRGIRTTAPTVALNDVDFFMQQRPDGFAMDFALAVHQPVRVRCDIGSAGRGDSLPGFDPDTKCLGGRKPFTRKHRHDLRVPFRKHRT